MTNIFDLTGKIAIVTGASSGLGIQFANALADQGASIAIAARRKDRLDALAKQLNDRGKRCIAIQCDVSKEEDIIKAVEQVIKHYGRIDILINNSGTANAFKAEEQSTEEWKRIIDVNLTGVYLFAREVGKVMIAQKYGKIINIGSIHSNLAISSAIHSISAYCASKGGVQMLTKSLAAEWAKYNITVNAIAPAYFPSEMTADAAGSKEFEQFIQFRCPMGRMGKDGELNGAVIYFASDASSYTTGQTLNIDGGWNTI